MARGSDGVRIEGLSETIRSLEKLGVDVEDLRQAFSGIAARITSEAQGEAPQDTGRLASTIRPAKTKNKAVVRAGSASAPYAGVINYGWPGRGIEATEFLTGPANRDPGRNAAEVEENLRHLIRKYDLN